MYDCDFIPARYHEAQSFRRAIKLRASCVAALLLIMAVWFGVHRQRCAAVQAMIADVAQQHQQIDIHLAKKGSMEAERARLEDHQRLLEHLAGNQSFVVVFSDISRRLPETVVLTEISISAPSLERYAREEENKEEEDDPGMRSLDRTSFPPDRTPPASRRAGRPTVDQITLIGIARDIPEVIDFAAALEESPLFDRVQREMKKEKTAWAGRRVQQFELTCDLVKQVGAMQ